MNPCSPHPEIGPQHLGRKAIVYVRQSSLRQAQTRKPGTSLILLVEVSCRTIGSRYLLKPSKEANELIAGVLARSGFACRAWLDGYWELSSRWVVCRPVLRRLHHRLGRGQRRQARNRLPRSLLPAGPGLLRRSSSRTVIP